MVESVGNDTFLINKIFYGINLYNHNIEQYISTLQDVSIEKLTGSRIHIVFKDSVNLAQVFLDVVKYSFSLINNLNNDARLNSLANFELNAGADYGEYLDWPVIYLTNVLENNTIGIPASRAAKIQSKAGDGMLVITDALYHRLGTATIFNEILAPQGAGLDAFRDIRQQYNGIHLYGLSLSALPIVLNETENSLMSEFSSHLKMYQRDSSYSDTLLSFIKDKTYSNPQKETGFVFYSDIRGSTQLLEKNKDRLDKISTDLMNEVLKMLEKVFEEKLVHVQVQGDRESCIGIAIGNLTLENIAIRIIHCGFSILSNSTSSFNKVFSLSNQSLAVGIGVSYGDFYESIISKNQRQDHLILGKTVISADNTEDKGAAEKNTFALDESAFRKISNTNDKGFNKTIQEKFIHKGRYYVASCDGNEFLRRWMELNLKNDNEQSKLNEAKPYCK